MGLALGASLSVGSPRKMAMSAATAFSPSSISDLKLWLKADAGVTYVPTEETFISEIEIDGAGTTTSNGTYTRVSGGSMTFQGPNGNTIYWDGEAWFVYDNDIGDATYYNYDLSVNGWGVTNGDSPIPSASNTTTTATYNYVDSWEDQSGSGNNATPIPDHAPIFQSANNSAIGKDCVYFYAAESYSPYFNGLTIPGADFDSATEATMFIVARQLVAGPYANGNFFSLQGPRKWQLTSGYMLLNGGDYNGGVNPNIGESPYSNYPLTLFAVRPDVISGIAKTTTIFSESWTNDNSETINAGRYDYTGELNRGPVIEVELAETDVEIGTRGNYSENLKGEICEILFYNRSLTDTEFENVVTYLNQKYEVWLK